MEFSHGLWFELLQHVGLFAIVVVLHSTIQSLTAAVVSPRLQRFILGSTFGGAAVLGMVEPVVVAPGVLADPRLVMVALASVFGGPIGGIAAGVIVAGYRLWLGGAGAAPATVSITLVIAITLTVIHVLRRKNMALSYRHLVLVGILVGGVGILPTVLMLPWQVAARVLSVAGLALPVSNCLGIVLVGALLLLEQRRRQLEIALAESEQRAGAASRAKSEFLANMSHELRTPLNAILGFSDLIASQTGGVPGNNHAVWARDINTAGQHLLELINEILDFSKAEAGMLTIGDEVVDVTQTTELCIQLLQPRAARGGVSIESFASSGRYTLRGDARRFKQILLNLLSNAIKYTPAGGEVGVIAALDQERRLAITVYDTGVGIAEEEVSRVMEPFYQVADPSARNSEGTGLGLPLTKRLVELHGGELHLESTLGQGTRATALFPAQRVILPSAGQMAA